jgi:hypothetical protein
VIRNLCLAAAAVMILVGCRVGLDNDEKEGDCAPVTDSLPGAWRSDCLFLEVRQNEDDEDENIFFQDLITFDGDEFTRDYREFADIDCLLAAERLVVSAEGIFNVADDLTISSEGLEVCEIDFAYDDVSEEVDEDDIFEEPDTPFDVFDILYLLPEPDGGDAEPRSLFTGDLDGPFIENDEAGRPESINFDVEYIKR